MNYPLMFISKPLWSLYFIIYFIVMSSIMVMLKMMHISFMNQMSYFKHKFEWNIFSMMGYLSMAGFFTFLEFITKWISIQEFISESMYILTLIFIISTMLLIFSYTRLMIASILLII